jgi:hypothetical protein
VEIALEWRGLRIAKGARRADLVLVDARYTADGRRVSIARGYERRGDVWSDLVILDRDSIVNRLKRGRKVFTGRTRDLPGDFELLSPVSLTRSGETLRLGSEKGENGVEALELPGF